MAGLRTLLKVMILSVTNKSVEKVNTTSISVVIPVIMLKLRECFISNIEYIKWGEVKIRVNIDANINLFQKIRELLLRLSCKK